jgi:hypothetical protein
VEDVEGLRAIVSVARWLEELAEIGLEHLARHVLGQRVQELIPLRTLEAGDVLEAERTELRPGLSSRSAKTKLLHDVADAPNASVHQNFCMTTGSGKSVKEPTP